jgi:hypothetical protein
MLFEITKPITAFLKVECNTREEAEAWANKIVVTLENENGTPVLSNTFIAFESETIVSEVGIIAVND